MEQTAIQLPEIVTPAVTDEYLGGIGTAPISVNTDFLLRKSSCVHYGAPSVLANFYHHPGINSVSSDDEESRTKKRKKKKRKKRRRKKRKKNQVKQLKSASPARPVSRRTKLLRYFSPDTLQPKVRLQPALSPIKLVAMKTRAEKLGQLLVSDVSDTINTSVDALVNFTELLTTQRKNLTPATVHLGSLHSKKLVKVRYKKEMAAIIIQRLFSRNFLARQHAAAVIIQCRVREHNWCKEVIRNLRHRHGQRFLRVVFFTMNAFCHSRQEAKRMAKRILKGVQAKCFIAWQGWTAEELRIKEEKRKKAVSRIVNGKIARSFDAWHHFVVNNIKLRQHEKKNATKALFFRVKAWKRWCKGNRASNIIRRFWRSMMIPIAMHRAYLHRQHNATQIQKIMRAFLSRKYVAALKIFVAATKIQKTFRGILGRAKAQKERENTILREEIRSVREEHAVMDVMDNAQSIVSAFLKSYRGRQTVKRYEKYLWGLKRVDESNADKVLTKTYQIRGEDEDVLELEDNSMLRGTREFVSVAQMVEFAYSVFDLVDVSRHGVLNSKHLVEVMKEIGVSDPEYDASTVRREHSNRIRFEHFSEWFVASYPQWGGESRNFFSRAKHKLGMHRRAAAYRAVKQASLDIVREIAVKTFRQSSAPNFEDDVTGHAYGTLRQFNASQTGKKKKKRGPFNHLRKFSKAGVAKAWLNHEEHSALQKLTSLVLHDKQMEILSEGAGHHFNLLSSNAELVLRYKDHRLFHRKRFDVVLPPLYESIDLDRELFYERSGIADSNISRSGHVRLTHGLGHSVIVRAIGRNGLVIKRSDAALPEEINRLTNATIKIGDQIYLYVDIKGTLKHEFLLTSREIEDSDDDDDDDDAGKGGYMARLRRKHKKKRSRKTDVYKTKRKSKLEKGWGKVAGFQRLKAAASPGSKFGDGQEKQKQQEPVEPKRVLSDVHKKEVRAAPEEAKAKSEAMVPEKPLRVDNGKKESLAAKELRAEERIPKKSAKTEEKASKSVHFAEPLVSSTSDSVR